MKRSRDDAFMSSELRCPEISSRAERSGQAQMSLSSAPKLTTNDALTYLKEVKDIFQDDRDKYDDFLDIMKDFKSQRVGTTGVILRVKQLFKGHRHLILGFNTFLPKGFEIPLPMEDEPLPKKKTVEFEEAISFVNKIKTTFQGDEHVYKAFLDILNVYRKDNKSIKEVYQEVSELFHDHIDLLVDFTHFLPDLSSSGSVYYAQSGRDHSLHQNDRVSPTTTSKPISVEKYIYHPESDQWNCLEKEKEKREDREESNWEHDNVDFKTKPSHTENSVTDQFYQGTQGPLSSFCEKVKERLQDPINYEKFSDCIRSYRRKFITSSQFHMLVASLLGAHPDLMEECEDFLTYVEKTGCLDDNKNIVRSVKVDDQDAYDRAREDRDKYEDCNNKGSAKYDGILNFTTKDVTRQRIPLYASKEKFVAKTIHELDLSNCESCTPSYRLLPQNYPTPLASRRTEVASKVLNDRWVSVTSGSEDYSFKHMRKNQYEESLFRCEDDRFELDMLLESVNATIMRVEELLESINANSNMTECSFCIEDHLTALNLRCIERLYGDHGLDVMDVLRKNAPLALPIILIRLKQKQEEWARCQSDFNKVWAEIYSKNYHKSLDHRSFYFKQQDTRILSAKALLAEIKEKSEKNQNEGDMLLSIGAGYRQHLRPHMEFEYSDPEVHEDLYQLMKNSCGEVCAPELYEKIMTIWTTFLEPVLGVPPRHLNAEDTEDVKDKKHLTKRMSSFGEENGRPVDEGASGNCKPCGVLKHGDKTIPTENIFSSSVGMGIGNNEIKIVGSPEADRVSYKSDVLVNAPENAMMQTYAKVMSAVPVTCKQAGVLDQGASRAAGENSTYAENSSNPPNESDNANANSRTDALPSKESQEWWDSVRPVFFSIETVHEEVKAQKCHEEAEASAKSDREEGEVSPNGDLGDNIVAFVNTSAKAAYITRKSDGSMEITGNELCIEESGQKINANGDEEDGNSTHGPSDSENTSENCHVSASESECSPGEPDEVGNNNDNDNKVDSEEEDEGGVDVHRIEGMTCFYDRLLQTAKPVTVRIPSELKGKDKNSQIFYGNDSFYLLFRLHHMLYERMQNAKLHSSSPENRRRILNEANHIDSYARFKVALQSLLNGSSDNAKFEDDCRAIIGAQSYVLFTLDKLIHKLVKQLQTIVTEEMDNKLLLLFAYERSRNAEKFSDTIYYDNACFLLPDDNLYRIECLPSPLHLSIQLMINEHDNPEVTAVSMDLDFVSNLKHVLLSTPSERNEKPGVFLKRNKRKCSTGDETFDVHNSMEGLIICNGLECKVNCYTMKMAYVLYSEDFLYRTKKGRKTLYQNCLCSAVSNGGSSSNSHRVKRCRKFMFC